jgi:integrase
LPEGTLPRSPITRPEYRLGQKPGNAGKRYPAEVITRKEFLRMLDAFPTSGPHYRNGVRDRALWATICRSGVRIAEALDLELRDVDLDYGRALVRHGKGDKSRVVPIDEFTAELLTEWFELRRLVLSGESPAINVTQRAPWRGPWEGGPDHGALFCVVKGVTAGRRMHDAAVREALKAAAARADVHRRVHPHGGRHLVASEWLMEGAPLPLIQDLLGHESIRTTELYANKLRGPEPMIRFAHQRARPDAA